MGRLVSYVHVEGPDGMVAFGPDDEVPEWAARKMGAHCFEDGEHPYAGDDMSKPLDELTVKQLRARADAFGVDLGDATKKADIVAMLEAARSDAPDGGTGDAGSPGD
jgi:hypothetical protein